MTDDSRGWAGSIPPGGFAALFRSAEEREPASSGSRMESEAERARAPYPDKVPFDPFRAERTAPVAAGHLRLVEPAHSLADHAGGSVRPVEAAPPGAAVAAADAERARIVAAVEALAAAPEAGAVQTANGLRDAFRALGSGGTYAALKDRVHAACSAILRADRDRTQAEAAAQRDAERAARQEERQARIAEGQARHEAADQERERLHAERAAKAAEREASFERHAAAKRRVINLILEASRSPGVPGRVDAIKALHTIWQEIGSAGAISRQLAEDYAAARKIFRAAERAERTGGEPGA